MSKPPPLSLLLEASKKAQESSQLFAGNSALIEKNKAAAKEQLLRIQLLLAKRPIK